MSATPYTPIDCSFHDRLEHHAVLGKTVQIVFRDREGNRREREVIIRDVFTRDGADWVVVHLDNRDELTLRADDVLSVNE